MPIRITGVEPGSPAAAAGLRAGDELVSIGGNTVRDVLDYRFYMTDAEFSVGFLRGGEALCADIKKAEYEELGLQFETYLMDKQHHCANRCVFCFVDQLPKGLRESLYFKDDDSRMSFLFGSYVTLTNMTEEDVRRIIKLRLSPVNISVHTTDPELRVKMMANPRAGEVLPYIKLFTDAGISVNAQIVLCPGLNDGASLERTLGDLAALAPELQSIAIVPVGLTAHREGLYPLRTLTAAEVAETIALADRFGAELLAKHGSRIVYCADELYITAGLPVPPAEYYEDFPQLDNGVGTSALMAQEFADELARCDGSVDITETTVVCGKAAEQILKAVFASAAPRFPNARVNVVAAENRLFGSSVTVSGLLGGRDILAALAGRRLGSRVLLPNVMLRHERDRFLDDVTLDELRAAIDAPVEVLEADGGALLRRAYMLD